MRGSKDGVRLSSVMLTYRTRGDRHRFKKPQNLSTRKFLFTPRLSKNGHTKWHKLLRGAEKSPSLEILRTKLDVVLLDQVWTR